MNNERRKQIRAQYAALEALNNKIIELKSEAETIRDAMQAIRDEEQESFDNMPEGLQQGDRGQWMEEVMNHLDTAIDAIGEVCDLSEMDDVMTALDDAENA